MTRKTEARLTSYEREIYAEGQRLCKQGKDKMQMARDMADARISAAERKAEAKRLEAIQNLSSGARILMEDITKAQGLGDYKFKVSEIDCVKSSDGGKVVISLTLAVR